MTCAPTSDGSPQPCTTDQIGNVIKQDPQPGNIAKTTGITLTVGKSPNTFALPDDDGQVPGRRDQGAAEPQAERLAGHHHRDRVTTRS